VTGNDPRNIKGFLYDILKEHSIRLFFAEDFDLLYNNLRISYYNTIYTITLCDLNTIPNTLYHYKLKNTMHNTLIILYYKHTISTTILFYFCHATANPIAFTTLHDYTILYNAITLYFYFILLLHSLLHIRTISLYYIMLIIIHYTHIYSIITNCYNV